MFKLLQNLEIRGDYFRFGSVFIKKSNQTEFKKKTESKLIQTDRFWFSLVWFFGQKPVQTGLARFFLVWLGFCPVARFFLFFSVWVQFGLVFLVSRL
jgi:hypothetical protein